MRKNVENVLSGEQIITDGRPARVDGVSDPVDGQVTVYAERAGCGRTYEVGTVVDVVS